MQLFTIRPQQKTGSLVYLQTGFHAFYGKINKLEQNHTKLVEVITGLNQTDECNCTECVEECNILALPQLTQQKIQEHFDIRL